MDNQTQLEILIETLEKIAARAPAEEPKLIDATRAHYVNGFDVSSWEAAKIARAALADIKGDSNG